VVHLTGSQDRLTVIGPSRWTWIAGTRQHEIALDGTPDELDNNVR
jgi:hypothetical protein